MKDIKKLLEAATTAARDLRSAMRLLEERLKYEMVGRDHEALRAFLAEYTNHDSVSELFLCYNTAQESIGFVTVVAASAVNTECARHPNKRAKYEAITDEVMDRISEACPCRSCMKSRASALKAAVACVQKTRRQVMKEPRTAKRSDS